MELQPNSESGSPSESFSTTSRILKSLIQRKFPELRDQKLFESNLGALSSHLKHPLDLETDLTMPILQNSPQSDSCPNTWWYMTSSKRLQVKAVAAYKKRMEAQRSNDSAISTKDQLCRTLFAFFSQLGLKRCTAQSCKRNKDRVLEVIPQCRWQLLREAIVTLIGCWVNGYLKAKSASRAGNQPVLDSSPRKAAM